MFLFDDDEPRKYSSRDQDQRLYILQSRGQATAALLGSSSGGRSGSSGSHPGSVDGLVAILRERALDSTVIAGRGQLGVAGGEGQRARRSEGLRLSGGGGVSLQIHDGGARRATVANDRSLSSLQMMLLEGASKICEGIRILKEEGWWGLLLFC